MANMPTTLLRSALALAAATVALVLVNAGGSRVSGAIPAFAAGDARLAADLAWLWLGGIAAAWAAAALAPAARGRHVLAFFAALGVGALWWMLDAGDDFPAWFSIGALAGLPLQGLAGARLGRERRRGA